MNSELRRRISANCVLTRSERDKIINDLETLEQLRSKIDKAIEEIQNANVCECHCITCIRTEDVLEIIKRNIGE